MRVGVGGATVDVGRGVSVGSSLLPKHAPATTTKMMDRIRGGARCTSLGICIVCLELYHRWVLKLLVAMTRKDVAVVK